MKKRVLSGDKKKCNKKKEAKKINKKKRISDDKKRQKLIVIDWFALNLSQIAVKSGCSA